MNTKYFEIKENAELTEEVIKLLWRKLVIKLHPDKGGSEEQFKEAQQEYEMLLQNMGAGFTAYQDSPDNFDSWDDFLAAVSPTVKECLEATRQAGAKRFEICGRWIWVSLDRSEVETRTKLKEIRVNDTKYRFSKNKLKWYWAGVKCRSRGNHSMNYIRNMYGSTSYEKEDEKRIAA